MLNLLPINLVTAPNYWSPIPEKFWTVTGGQAATLAGLLQIIDPFGTRPYVPQSGATLQAVFQRGDNIGGNTTVLTVTKMAVLDTNFRSLATLPLTTQDAGNIISGTLVLTLTEGVNVQNWVQNWAVKRLNTQAGC